MKGVVWTGDKPLCRLRGHKFKPCFRFHYPHVPRLFKCSRCGRYGLGR